MWTTARVLEELKARGTAQNQKVYARHGVESEIYGVSYADMKALKKQVKTQHDIAKELWASGIHDACFFAALIADPKAADSELADAWAEGLSDYVVTDALSGYLGQTDLVQEKAEAWLKSPDEWRSTLGWNLLGSLAMSDQILPDSYFEKYIAHIEAHIHDQPNRTRYAMNNTLICIGIRNEALQEQAVAAAKRIGKVEVDHGETNCKTPEASAYIAKTWARKAKPV